MGIVLSSYNVAGYLLLSLIPELGINEELEYREEMYTDKLIGI